VKKEEEAKKGVKFFEISAKGEQVKWKKITQLIVWFHLGLKVLGSSHNGQNSLIHNWCILMGSSSLKPIVCTSRWHIYWEQISTSNYNH
jgi:hypothetical protein